MKRFGLAGAAVTLALGLMVAGCSKPADNETTQASNETAALTRDYTALLAAEDRSAEDKAQDANRKPAEVLALIGVKEGQTVVDLGTIGGYYAEILARAVGPSGAVYAVNSPPVLNAFPEAHQEAIARSQKPGLSQLKPMVVAEDALPAEWQADVVFVGLYYHDFINDYFKVGLDRAKVNAAIYNALKPGGLYVIEDHLNAPGAGAQAATDLHRGDPDITRAEVLAAGFEPLAENLDLFANPDDPRTNSVFDPAIRGHTARFLFIFRKPAN